MDYEKAYNEALERAKAGKPLDEVFPELKESEDERIRKKILALVKKHAVNHERCQMEAYLEKQKEKPLTGIYWHAIKEGDMLPCRAYLWTTNYEKYHDSFDGRLIPNVENITVGADMWYLPVDDIRALPREGIDELPKEQEFTGRSIAEKNTDTIMSYIKNDDSLVRFKKQDELRDLLEKPIEQKPTNSEKPKFKVGDKVYSIRNRFECIIEEVDETTYYGDTTNFDIKDQDEWKLVNELKQKPAECMVPPPSDPFMFNLHSAIYNFGKQIAAECLDTHILDTELDEYVTHENVDKYIKEKISCLVKYHPLQQPAEWSEEDEWKRNELLKYLKEKGDYRSTWYFWLENLPERFNLQPKQEWSEEDEKYLNLAINIVASELGEDSPTVTRLKSLRPQIHWKPSKEQMIALEYFIRSWGESGTMSPQNPTLCAAKSLYNDLKKLM